MPPQKYKKMKILGPNMDSKMVQNCEIRAQANLPGGLPNMGPKLDPKMGPKMGPKMAQDCVK